MTTEEALALLEVLQELTETTQLMATKLKELTERVNQLEQSHD